MISWQQAKIHLILITTFFEIPLNQIFKYSKTCFNAHTVNHILIVVKPVLMITSVKHHMVLKVDILWTQMFIFIIDLFLTAACL